LHVPPRKGWRFIELTAIREDRLDSLVPFLEQRRDALDCFERVSIHAPITPDHTSMRAVVEKLVALAWEFDTVVHPDLRDVAGPTAQMSDCCSGSEGRCSVREEDCETSFSRSYGSLSSVCPGSYEGDLRAATSDQDGIYHQANRLVGGVYIDQRADRLGER
jgi:hypothetical protein